MANNDPSAKPDSLAATPWSDPGQQEIYENLRLIGEGPAAFYRDACRIMADGSLDSTTHLVGHLVREIESALINSLETFAVATPDKPSKDQDRAFKIERISQGLGFGKDDPIIAAWLEFPLHSVAHRDALSAPRPPTLQFGQWWSQIQAILFAVTNGLKQHFLQPLGEVDRLMAISNPSKADARFLRNKIPNNAVFLGHFFDRCQNPKWVGPLAQVGFFRNHRVEGRWPEAGYLARMSGVNEVSTHVCEILLSMPESKNPIVHIELLEGIQRMPPPLASKLTAKIKIWANADTSRILDLDLGKFVAKLAAGGAKQEAMDLAATVLQVMPGEKLGREENDEAHEIFRLNPRIRSDLSNYEEILKTAVPELVKSLGLDAITLLRDLLSSAIRFSLRKPEESAPNDVSAIWRPAVEEHEQNSEPELKSLLTRTLRDSALAIVESGQASLVETIETLQGAVPPWRIFQRISMFLLDRVIPPAIPLVKGYLTNKDLFESPECRFEYALLVKHKVRELDPASFDTILSWVADPPALEVFRENARIWGREMSEEDALRTQRFWQRDRLAWFGDALPPEWKQRYEELVSELGKPEHPEFSRYATSHTGPSSPKSIDDLRMMEVDDLLEYLKNWQPSQRFMGASREGLARELSSLVVENPQRFSSAAYKFQGLHPTYVRAAVSGFGSAWGKKINFDFGPILSLCKWVMEQRDEAVPKAEIPHWVEEDTDWSWTRTAIAHLIDGVLTTGADRLPLDLRNDIWEILRRLSRDSNPTPEFEASHDASTDPSHIAINSTRGVAMEAITYYATWLSSQFERLENGNQKVSRGFDEMPEVREVLDWHLHIENDPSLAIRSMYGRRFPWIRLIDDGWAQSNLNRIFPEDDSNRVFWEAAWGTYITHCNAYDDVLPVLTPKYRLAIERLGTEPNSKYNSQSWESQLAAHLMAFYWHGNLGLEDDGLLEPFFSKALAKTRSYAVEVVGRWLWNATKSGNALSAELLERLRKLWEWRYEQARQSTDVSEYAREGAAFVWWFRSGAFDEEWAVTNLDKALEIAIKGNASALKESIYATLDRLPAVSLEYPIQSVRSLQKLLYGASSWRIGGFEKEIRAVLSQALQSGQESADIARATINALAVRAEFCASGTCLHKSSGSVAVQSLRGGPSTRQPRSG